MTFCQISSKLSVMVLVAAGAVGCALPMRPGCTPGASLPSSDEPFLKLATVEPVLSSSVFVDRTGRSYFSPDHTAWMLSTVAVCRTIAAEDLQLIKKAWEEVAHASGNTREEIPDRPYMFLNHYTDDGRRVQFHVKPRGAGERPQLESALRLTMRVLEDTYGDRFVREIRAAGLQDLLRESSEAAEGGKGHSQPKH